MDMASSDSRLEMTAYLTQQQQTMRTAKKGGKGGSTETKSVSREGPSTIYHSSNNSHIEERHMDSTEVQYPLRWKPNFKKLILKRLGNPRILESRNEGDDNLVKAKQNRTTMQKGKLEVVIPPPKKPGGERLIAPPRSARQPNPYPTFKHSSKSSASSASRLVEYIRASADSLEETRQELTSKFRSPFEHLNHHSSALPRSDSKVCTRGSPCLSEESFFCIGEEVEAGEAQAIRARGKGEGRASNKEGASPKGRGEDDAHSWVDPWPGYCRLCGDLELPDAEGLCRDCEPELMHPKLVTRESSSSWTSSWLTDDEDFKPTPPLKDGETLLLRRNLHRHQPIICSVDTKDLPPAPQEVEIIAPAPWQLGHHALLGGDANDNAPRLWQPGKLKAAFEETRRLFPMWAHAYENEDYLVCRQADDEHHQTLALAAREDLKGGGLSERDTAFYRFWDGLLPGTPTTLDKGG